MSFGRCHGGHGGSVCHANVHLLAQGRQALLWLPLVTTLLWKLLNSSCRVCRTKKTFTVVVEMIRRMNSLILLTMHLAS